MDAKTDLPGGDAMSEYRARARYFTPQNAFKRKQPPVPAARFVAERKRALDPNTPTGWIPLDLGPQMGMDYPATAPHILVRYGVIRAGEKLASRFRASGEFYFVIRGRGESRSGRNTIAWSEGDVFTLPGGNETIHSAIGGDAIIYVGTDEPALAFNHLQPPAPGDEAAEAVLYRADEISAEVEKLYQRNRDADLAGQALFLSTDAGDRYGTVTPAMIATITTLEAGGDQRPHRHNAVAIQLVVQGEGCYSVCDGVRSDWEPFDVLVTPPGAVHSLANRGDKTLRAFIFQDSGLYYYLRATGFSFAD
jgi:gentisate 1,2-dioxygenase